MFSVSSFTENRLPISAASVTEASFYSAVLIPFLITAPATAEAMPATASTDVITITVFLVFFIILIPTIYLITLFYGRDVLFVYRKKIRKKV